MDAKPSLKIHTGWSRLLVVILSIALVLASFLAVIRNNFGTGTKAFLFIKEAKGFENISELAKVEITSNLPDSVKNNFIKNALVQKIVDIAITPENVAKIAEPGLVNLYKLSGSAADLATKKIEFNTIDFKKQSEQYLPKLGLSTSFTDTTLEFIKSVPDNITILNVEKNPNSPIALFLKIQKYYKLLNSLTDTLWWLAALSVLGVVLINLKSKNRILSSIYWPFGVAGAVILALCYISPSIISAFMPSSTSAAQSTAIDNLVSGLTNNYFGLVRGFGWLFIIIAILALAIHWLINSDRVMSILKEAKQKIRKSLKSKK